MGEVRVDMLHESHRRSVLCVGKDGQDRAFLEAALTGYELVFAQSAFGAISSMNTRAFDAFVVDYWLPDWSGIQLCRAIRDSDPHCPVLFWSAGGAEQNRQRAMRAGATAVFRKDQDADKLEPALCELLALADVASLAAKVHMDSAAAAEITRCAILMPDGAALPAVSGSFVERSARRRACDAFLAARGCRAHFERWWPQVFATALANHDVALDAQSAPCRETAAVR